MSKMGLLYPKTAPLMSINCAWYCRLSLFKWTGLSCNTMSFLFHTKAVRFVYDKTFCFLKYGSGITFIEINLTLWSIAIDKLWYTICFMQFWILLFPAHLETEQNFKQISGCGSGPISVLPWGEHAVHFPEHGIQSLFLRQLTTNNNCPKMVCLVVWALWPLIAKTKGPQHSCKTCALLSSDLEIIQSPSLSLFTATGCKHVFTQGGFATICADWSRMADS